MQWSVHHYLDAKCPGRHFCCWLIEAWAVRYGGTDQVVLNRLMELGAAEACDHLS